MIQAPYTECGYGSTTELRTLHILFHPIFTSAHEGDTTLITTLQTGTLKPERLSHFCKANCSVVAGPGRRLVLPNTDKSIIQSSHHGTTLTVTIWVAKILRGFYPSTLIGEMARPCSFVDKTCKVWESEPPWTWVALRLPLKGCRKYTNHCFSGPQGPPRASKGTPPYLQGVS